MERSGQLAHSIAAVGQKGDVLSRKNALRLEYGAQPPLGLFVDPAHEGKDFGGSLLRDAFAGDYLKASVAARWSIATSDVTTVEGP
jgi:hypothetical protein